MEMTEPKTLRKEGMKPEVSKEQELWQASTDGDLEIVKVLMADPAVDVNWQDDEHRRTPFYRACGHGKTGVVKYMMQDPRVNVTQETNDLATPFFIACQKGSTDVVKLLLRDPRQEVCLKKANSKKATPFLIACENGNFDVAILLLNDPRFFPEDFNTLQKEGASPLHMASFNGKEDVVRLLLADPRTIVDTTDCLGVSVFFLACQGGHRGVVSLLMQDPRFDLNLPDKHGYTPFFVACENGHSAVVSLLLADERIDILKSSIKQMTPFYGACEKGQTAVVELLLADWRMEAEVNRPKHNRSTPLWFASQEGHFGVVQRMLASRILVDTQTKSEFNNYTASEQGRAMGRKLKTDESEEVFQQRRTYGPQCADLIDEYEGDPEGIRARLRRMPEIRDHYIGHTYALVVFFSDNFLALPEAVTTRTQGAADVAKFFLICSRLPLDLQMVLCNRMFSSPRNIVLSRDSEQGFKWLGRFSTWMGP